MYTIVLSSTLTQRRVSTTCQQMILKQSLRQEATASTERGFDKIQQVLRLLLVLCGFVNTIPKVVTTTGTQTKSKHHTQGCLATHNEEKRHKYRKVAQTPNLFANRTSSTCARL